MVERIPTVTDQADDGLADFYRQRPAWAKAEAPIPATVEKATVLVPVDYTQPSGEVIDLAMVRHAATGPAERLGVLLVAPDDPGTRGIPLLWQLLPSLPSQILERYDVVCFDHRFSGDSAPLNFGLTMAEIFWVFHSSPDFEAECRFQEGIARKAADNALKRLPQMTSLNIARDMDVIRGALGEEKISFLGYSYGSYLGAVYTQLFGAHADRVVLDSVISPDWVWRGLFRAIAASMEACLTDWAGQAARCQSELRLGDTPESVRRTLDDLLAAASRQPVIIPGLPLPLDGTLLRLATMALLRSDRTHSLLGDFARAAAHQEPPSPATMEFFGAAFGQLRDGSTAAAQLAILCGDHPWPRAESTYRVDAHRDGIRYPFIGMALSGIKAGAFWPVTPREPVAVIGPDNPAESVLLVQSAGDVFTPYQGACRLHALLPHNSRLITVADSVQHRVFPFYQHTEVNELVSAYLVRGELPATDLTCVNPTSRQTRAEKADLVSTTTLAADAGKSFARLDDFYTQRPSWDIVTEGNLAGLELAGVAVPLDYTCPDGPATEIMVGRHRAPDPAQRLGVLLVGPGDDLGNPGLTLTAQLVASLPAEILTRYDLVGFDLRFMGRSCPIELEYTQAERYWVFHTPRSFEEEVRIQSDLAEKVGKSNEHLLGHAHSRNAARDIEVIRHVLGEDKISYLGYSYGTYLGAVYTQMFGEHAERVVLDSICSPDWVWRGLFTDFPPNGELALKRWSRWAAKQDEEYGLGATAEQVRSRYHELLKRADSGELVPVDEFECDQTMIRLIAVGPLNSELAYPFLGEILRTAVHGGELQPFTKQFVGQMFAPPESTGVVAQLSVLSGDRAWPRDLELYRREMQSYRRRYPFTGAAMGGVKAPVFWPIPPREPVTPLSDDNPAPSVLIVQSEHDMSTPHAAAVRMHEVLHHNSRLITLGDTAHHKVFPFYGDAGINDLVTEYLLTGERPGQDLTCANRNPQR